MNTKKDPVDRLGLQEQWPKQKPSNFGITTSDWTVYKKVKSIHTRRRDTPYGCGYAIAVLVIPKGTLVRLSDHKCRAASAKVVKIMTVNGNKPVKSGYSGFDYGFNYLKGRTVNPVNGFSALDTDCAGGIHFLRTVAQARTYDL